jgi:hypothetical protein
VIVVNELDLTPLSGAPVEIELPKLAAREAFRVRGTIKADPEDPKEGFMHVGVFARGAGAKAPSFGRGIDAFVEGENTFDVEIGVGIPKPGTYDLRFWFRSLDGKETLLHQTQIVIDRPSPVK